MPVKKLKKFLDEQRVKYTVISHSTAYTAQEIAQSAHITGKELAKTVMVELDGEMTMVVVPASRSVDFEYLKEATGSEHAALLTEAAFKACFPDCEIGAMPPFGHLYGMKLIVDKRLADDKEIAFNAGNHRELIKMPFGDYQRLAKPHIMDLTAYNRESIKTKK
ncbi:MAG: deacylase [Omnitrophica WOR_2 bacterium RIFCSPHIGHO2_02_FULL_52_10]|nr:MAG: deacylase [Omnitrophica WOR_2 bacterium RIFCSPHIGHO2_02_FULL_52_10]